MNDKKIKVFNVRISKDLWSFVKKRAVDKEVSINAIVNDLLENYRLKLERKEMKKLDSA